MEKLFLLFLVAAAYGQSCPNFGNFLPWTDKCLWLPLDEMRRDLIDSCDIKLPENYLQALPDFGEMPGKCGHCSYKARCQKRLPDGDCYPFKGETEVCHEHGDVCVMPKVPGHSKLGCKWDMAGFIFRQCINRPDIDDWMRMGFEDAQDKFMPIMHCKDGEGDTCNCCCHPYQPSEDGTACVEHTEPECEAWGEWNDWSEKCLWFPPKQMREDWQEHTGMEVPVSKKALKIYDKFEKLPGGADYPDRCGMCSFKFRARKRNDHSAAGKKECFPLQAIKKPCTDDDHDGASAICTVPKMFGACNITEQLRRIVGAKGHHKLEKMPLHMRTDFMKVLTNFPHPKCIEKDDQCKCCCYPYKPNADGTECVLEDMCNFPTDLSQIDWNVVTDDQALWFL